MPSHKASVRGHWEEYRRAAPLHKNFMPSCKRGVMNLDLKVIFTGEMLRHILIQKSYEIMKNKQNKVSGNNEREKQKNN